MKVYLISYADKNFKLRQALLNDSARKYGITNVISYSRKDLLKTDFYNKNRKILDAKKGAGYWLWKPYFILETLKRVNDDDIIIYMDAGMKFVSSPQPLLDICAKQESGLMLFDFKPVLNKWYTKRDAFVNLGCDNEKYWNSFQIMGILLIKKNDFSMRFIREWLEACSSENSLTDVSNVCGLPNLEGFIDHRHDLSILSILTSKYGLETFRNPTKHGNYLKLPAYREPGEEVNYPYYLKSMKMSYAEQPQDNSPYGTVYYTFPKNYEEPKEIFKRILSSIKRKLRL